jgi:sporulation protein YlmC with PRC-barrel domain
LPSIPTKNSNAQCPFQFRRRFAGGRPTRCGWPQADWYSFLDHEKLTAIVTFHCGFARGTRNQHRRLRAAQIIALKQKENPMLRKLALSASVLALAGILAVAQAETMTNPSTGRSVAEASSLSTMRWLASDVYKADVYDIAQDKIGYVTDLIMDNNGNVTTAVIGVGGFLGVGKKDVAVPFKDLKVASRDGKDWLVLNQTKQDLQNAPAYDKHINGLK